MVVQATNCEFSRSPLLGQLGLVSESFDYLSHLEAIYPGFQSWYYCKVIPGLATEERAVFVKQAHERPVGVAIAKRSHSERKLCTLWIDPRARLSGVAAELGAHAFAWLGTEKPLFTVPEEQIAEFRGLLNRWNFRAEQKLRGYYRPGKIEYVFNGRLGTKREAT